MVRNGYQGLLGTQCAGKVKFWTFEKATRRAEKVGAKRGVGMRAYYCGICGGYHITSRPR